MAPRNRDERPGERIAKLLARAGIASRREVERMIAEGRVAIDGVAVITPATVLTSLRGVTVDGHPVSAPPAARLFLHHKPAGLLVTERDPAGRPTIYDRLPSDLPRILPVGRLDLATEGLLLLTTDGGLKRQLELPATGVERAYRARAYGNVTQAALEELIEGVEIDGIRYGPIDANLERRTGANVWIEMILTEGKNREVRRVLEHLGLQVGRLIRTRYGPFVLGDLQPGEVGEVREADLVAFRRTLGAKRGKSDDARIKVAAREKPVPAPTPPLEAAPARTRRAEPDASRKAPSRPVRAKAPSGWGTRARPSRPEPVDRGDEHPSAPHGARAIERAPSRAGGDTPPRSRPAVRGDRPLPARDDQRPVRAPSARSRPTEAKQRDERRSPARAQGATSFRSSTAETDERSSRGSPAKSAASPRGRTTGSGARSSRDRSGIDTRPPRPAGPRTPRPSGPRPGGARPPRGKR